MHSYTKNCLKILIETISVSQESPSFFTHVGILRVSKLKTPVVTWKNYLIQWITNKSCNHSTLFNVAEDKESTRRKNEHLNFIKGHFLLCIPECIAACEEKASKNVRALEQTRNSLALFDSLLMKLVFPEVPEFDKLYIGNVGRILYCIH